MEFISFLIPIIVILGVILSLTVRIVPEYKRLVVFRLGRALSEPKGPGLVLLIPGIDKAQTISIRILTLDIDPQDVISRDNVTLKVNAVVYYRVVDPLKAVINIENYHYATSQLAQTHLRSTMGEHTLDEILTEREKINSVLQKILDENTDAWGIKVSSVEIKHVDLPTNMHRAMARQAEAERERRAKIISAEGEMQAAEKLREAADELSKNPVTIQLRYLQTLIEMGSENKSTVVFPLPIDLISNAIKSLKS